MVWTTGCARRDSKPSMIFAGCQSNRVTEWKHLNLNYKIVARIDEQKCIGCDLCHIACWDGAHQCIHLDRVTGPVDGHVEMHQTPAAKEAESRAAIAETPVSRKERERSGRTGPYPTPLARIPRVDETECVGCNLCSLRLPGGRMHHHGRASIHGLGAADVGERSTSAAFVAAAPTNVETSKRLMRLSRFLRIGKQLHEDAHHDDCSFKTEPYRKADAACKADLLIDGATIREVRAGIPASAADKVVDATGLLLLPGGIDAHTHLDMPFGGTTSADDFETGTRAAAIGGTTTIVDFAIQARGTKMRTALDTWWKKAEGKACIDFGLHMIVTDLPDAGLEDMDEMVREGVASFKLFMAYPNVLMVDDATIFKALRQTAKNGALICMHAENGSVIDVIVQQALAEGKTAPIYHALTRPTKAEAEAVHRAIAMAEMAGVPIYIVHLSSEDALNQVREARDRGLPAFAETCPQYLLLSLEDVADKGWEGAKYVFTPPLRERKNQPKLWEGLRKDNLQVVSTDHCPFCFADQKALGKDDFTKIPNGGPGIENRLQLLHHHGVGQGNFSINRFVELVSTAPARIFGMYPKKGVLAAGSDADLVLWDPAADYTISAATHHMRVDYSMFEGFHVRGNARDVYSRGELIVSGGKFIGKPGRGKYLRREARGGAWK